MAAAGAVAQICSSLPCGSTRRGPLHVHAPERVHAASKRAVVHRRRAHGASFSCVKRTPGVRCSSGDGQEEGSSGRGENAESSKEELKKSEESSATPESTSGSSDGKPGGGLFSSVKVTPIWAQQEKESLQLPKTTVETLRNSVFGYDTFFVTDQEAYQRGVLFRGNLRGDSAKAYSKIKQRLQEKFGDEFSLFMLVNPEDKRPVAAVVPSASLQPPPPAVPEFAAAGAFGLVALFTLFLRNSPSLELEGLSQAALTEGLPGASVMAALLALHEAGHFFAAKKFGLELGLPYLIPSWQLGTFGAITRIKSIVQKRGDLLEVAASGPLLSSAVALTVIVGCLVLPPAAGQGILVDSTIFHDSVLVGGLAKLALGDALQDGVKVEVNPTMLAAWTALLINSINCIPVGELDGGRIAQALFGREIGSRLSAVSILLLGVSALFTDVALYWVILVLFLQRGPIVPQADELTPPSSTQKALGAAALVFALLVYCPLLIPFT